MKKLLCCSWVVMVIALCGMVSAVNAEEIVPGADVTIKVVSLMGEELTEPVTLEPWTPIAVKATLTISNDFAYPFPIAARAVIGAGVDYNIVGTRIYQPGTYVGTHYILPPASFAGRSTELGGRVWIKYQQSQGAPPVVDSSTMDLIDASMP